MTATFVPQERWGDTSNRDRGIRVLARVFMAAACAVASTAVMAEAASAAPRIDVLKVGAITASGANVGTSVPVQLRCLAPAKAVCELDFKVTAAKGAAAPKSIGTRHVRLIAGVTRVVWVPAKAQNDRAQAVWLWVNGSVGRQALPQVARPVSTGGGGDPYVDPYKDPYSDPYNDPYQDPYQDPFPATFTPGVVRHVEVSPLTRVVKLIYVSPNSCAGTATLKWLSEDANEVGVRLKHVPDSRANCRKVATPFCVAVRLAKPLGGRTVWSLDSRNRPVSAAPDGPRALRANGTPVTANCRSVEVV